MLKRKLSRAFSRALPSNSLFGWRNERPLIIFDTSVDDLPDEVLLGHVFSYLDIADLGCAAQTCFHWDECLTSKINDTLNNTLWREICHRKWPDLVSSIILRSEKSDSYDFRSLCKEHLRSLVDKALFDPWKAWTGDELLANKPIEVHAIGWLVRNGNIKGSIEALSALTAPWDLIPTLFLKYERHVLEQYASGDVTDAVEFPEIPSNLSDKAERAHKQALKTVKRIYLDGDGNLKFPRPTFSYTSDIALYLSTRGCEISPYQVHQEIEKARSHEG